MARMTNTAVLSPKTSAAWIENDVDHAFGCEAKVREVAMLMNSRLGLKEGIVQYAS